MGPVYRRLGLSVGFVEQGMTAGDRRAAYGADVTYVTAKEAGFDHLRDLLAASTNELVHRPFHLAIVDEADSLLVDEARVPLVIAGHVARDSSPTPALAALVGSLAPGVDFDSDEYGRDVELTDAGVERAERALGCGSLHEERNLALLTDLNCALHARVSGGQIDLKGLLKGPASTWTYLVSDDPFRNQIGRMLVGPGRTTIAIAAAAFAMPLLILWGLVDRFVRRVPGRRSDSFRR